MRAVGCALLALGCGPLAGCGWSTRLSLGESYGSVGVEVFRNDSYLFDLERALHGEISRSVSNLVSAPLVAPERADVVLRGRILDYRRRGGIRSRDNRLLESAVMIRLEAELWDPRSEEIVVGPVPSQAQIGYTLDSPGTELEARERALHNLAQELVLELFGRLPTRPAGP